MDRWTRGATISLACGMLLALSSAPAFIVPPADPGTAKGVAAGMIFAGGAVEIAAGLFGIHRERGRTDVVLGLLSVATASILAFAGAIGAMGFLFLLGAWLLARGAIELMGGLAAETLAADRTAAALVISAGRRPTSEMDTRLAELDEALRIEPDFLPALVMRANTLWMEYRFQPALADANRALELEPGHPEAYAIKVKVLLDMDRRPEAMRMVDQLVEESAADARGLATAASLYARLENLTKARTTIERAREIAPSDAYVRSIAEYLS